MSSLYARQAQNSFPPPPGVTPNYVDPVNRGNEIVVPAIVLSILSFIVVVLRLVLKRKNKNNVGWDFSDFFIILAFAFSIARAGTTIYQVTNHYIGRHIWDIPHEILFGPIGNAGSNFTSISDIIYLLGIMCAKLSILFFYKAIFGVHRRFRWFCYGMMAFVFVYCIVFVFMTAFHCNPVALGWHVIGWTKPGKCIYLVAITWAIGAFNIATDLVLLIAPIPLVLKLHLSTRKKIGTLLVFATGLFVIAASIVREVEVVKFLRNTDQTWVVVPSVVWLSVELQVGIICACLPLLAPIWSREFLKQVFPSSVKSIISRISRSNASISSMSGSQYSKAYRQDSAIESSHTADRGPHTVSSASQDTSSPIKIDSAIVRQTDIFVGDEEKH